MLVLVRVRVPALHAVSGAARRVEFAEAVLVVVVGRAAVPAAVRLAVAVRVGAALPIAAGALPIAAAAGRVSLVLVAVVAAAEFDALLLPATRLTPLVLVLEAVARAALLRRRGFYTHTAAHTFVLYCSTMWIILNRIESNRIKVVKCIALYSWDVEEQLELRLKLKLELKLCVNLRRLHLKWAT